jgi:hypothetical protein
LIYVYCKSPKLGFILFYLLILVNILTNILIASRYDLKAGPLALENYYMFSYLMYKPYSKLALLSIGLQTGILYHHILLYRTLSPNNSSPSFIHTLHTRRSFFSPFLVLTGIGLILTCLFCGHEALKDPYSWPKWKNYVYFAMVRPAYVTGAMMLWIAMVTGNFNGGMRAMRGSYMRALGKLSFESALISPMVITLAY